MANIVFIPAPRHCQATRDTSAYMIRHFLFTVVVAFAFFAPGNARHGLAQAVVPTVTSDTPAYCDVLINRIGDLSHAVPTPREAMRLSMEGEKMCGHGQIRGGITRLRRALAILRNPGE